jgi:acyl-CoA thioester hydrolase
MQEYLFGVDTGGQHMSLEFIDTAKLRIQDINYAGHLGHVEILHLLHEVRIRYLSHYGVSEEEIFDHALMVKELYVTFKNQAFWGNDIKITMQVKLDKVRIVFDYAVDNLSLKNQLATAQIIMVLVNKTKKRIVNPNFIINLLTQGTK